MAESSSRPNYVQLYVVLKPVLMFSVVQDHALLGEVDAGIESLKEVQFEQLCDFFKEERQLLSQ